MICGERGDIEIDHIIARSKGGANDRSNLQPLCRVCNAIKRDNKTNKQLEQWIAENPEEFKRRKARRKNMLIVNPRYS